MPDPDGAQLTNYRLDFSYDGTDFHGYAVQPGLRTIQGVLQDALIPVLGSLHTHVAGRTDAGVHARNQVVNVECSRAIPAERLQRSLNRMLGPEIVFDSVAVVDPQFHARYNAARRTYRYFILNRRLADPFRARTTWHYRYPLALERLNTIAAYVVGEHEFTAMCRKQDGKSNLRTVESAEWWCETGDIVIFEIAANSFCHQMVRSIVALSVEIARGNREPGEFGRILERRDRNAAHGAAPAKGLFLWKVDYPP